MDKLHIIFACLLLKLIFDPCSAQHPDCQPCPPGYYLRKNCSLEADGRISGVQCAQCKDCSAEGQEMLTSCSLSSDSVCMDAQTVMPIRLPDFPSENWIILTATVASVVVALLLCLCLALYICQNRTGHKGGLGEP